MVDGHLLSIAFQPDGRRVALRRLLAAIGDHDTVPLPIIDWTDCHVFHLGDVWIRETHADDVLHLRKVHRFDALLSETPHA